MQTKEKRDILVFHTITSGPNIDGIVCRDQNPILEQGGNLTKLIGLEEVGKDTILAVKNVNDGSTCLQLPKMPVPRKNLTITKDLITLAGNHLLLLGGLSSDRSQTSSK